jgi:hypothetical protein
MSMMAFPGLAADETADEIAQLKAQLAAQQQQIDQLRLALAAQQKLLDRVAGSSVGEQSGFKLSQPATLGEVASTSPVVPRGDIALTPKREILAQQAAAEEPPSPLSLKIGSSYITPVGFMDLTYISRSTNGGSTLGSNFGSIPFNNVPQGKLSESIITPQNSRIGARVDTKVHGASVLGYWESDFLGVQPPNVWVSTNSYSFRLRLYYVDVKKDRWEVLGGQSWSLLTPNRKGISPLPGDLFYTQVTDTNYMIGLAWGRVPTFRYVWHPNSTIAWAFAAENPQQYIGGSGGGGLVTLPANLVGPLNNELNNGNTTNAVPNLHPDFITKLAFDPAVNGHASHFEVAGMLSSFKTFNPLNRQHYTTTGGGVSFNSNFELVKNVRLFENFFYSRGGGRYFFGNAPDVIINGDGRPSTILAGGTVDGIEWQTTKNLLLYAYYGGVYADRAIAIDPANGRQVGYGFFGSPNSNNRTIQEGTFGFQQTLWRDPRWGQLRIDGQYEYLWRAPWFVAPGSPKQAHDNTVYLNLRYALPGAPPALK